MRTHFILLLLAMGFCSGCDSKEKEKAPGPSAKPAEVKTSTPAPKLATNLVALAHFVGARQIGSDSNAASLKEIWSLPASSILKDEILNKLAQSPYLLLHQRTANTNDFASTLRPLLEDVFQEESFLEIGEPTNQTPELSFAIRLNDSRAQLWQSNLSVVLNGWTAIEGKEIEVDGLKGWELKKHDPPNLVRLVRVGEWLVLGVGQDQLTLQPGMLSRIKKGKRPGPAADDYWLNASMNLGRLDRYVPEALNVKLPVAHVTVSLHEGNIRTKALLSFPEPLGWKFEPWRIPTNTIREPVMAFTAMQGVNPLLSRLPQLQPYKWEPMPNQLYTWAVAEVPYQVFAAALVPNASNVLQELAPKVASALNTNLEKQALGGIVLHTNTLVWEKIPFIVPYIQAVEEPGGQFLFGGFFPNVRRTNPPPPELLSQVLGRTNLVYYDWEITGERLLRWRNLSQLLLVLAREPQLSTNSGPTQWFVAAGSKLGNTGTELTVTGSNEMTFIRKGPISLTALEMVALANWLESTNFPFFGYSLPAQK